METATKPTETVANATKTFTKSVRGFTYIKDYAAVTVEHEDKTVKVIIGSKQEFGMADMFTLKQAESVTFTELSSKIVNGIEYQRYKLESINF